MFAHDGIRGITDLKGKSVGMELAMPALLTLMAAQVGLDPKRDIRWVTDPKLKPLDLFAEGKIDAFLGFPPEVQILQARHTDHVIIDTAVDRPWSQYFCCMLAGSREYVQKYPVATKRVVRAILKATDLCAAEPARVARRLVRPHRQRRERVGEPARHLMEHSGQRDRHAALNTDQPGVAIGRTAPGGSGSITATGNPARRRYSAVDMPTMPAPTIATEFGSAVISQADTPHAGAAGQAQA